MEGPVRLARSLWNVAGSGGGRAGAGALWARVARLLPRGEREGALWAGGWPASGVDALSGTQRAPGGGRSRECVRGGGGAQEAARATNGMGSALGGGSTLK